MNLYCFGDKVCQTAATGYYACNGQKYATTIHALQILLSSVQGLYMTLEIDGEATIPVILSHLLLDVEEVDQPRPSGIGHDDVESALHGDGLGDKSLGLMALRDVGLNGIKSSLGAIVVWCERACATDDLFGPLPGENCS